MAPGRADHVIDSGTLAVVGADVAPKELAGRYRTHPEDIVLGEISTDARQRLTVLGGLGISASPVVNAPIGDETGGGSFYNNADWFDDVSDGPVTATILLPGGTEVSAEPAWIIVAPPDFAPAVRGLVTMYDVLRQVAIGKNWLSLPARPEFHRDVRPLLERASSLQWVNKSTVWPKVSTDWAVMSDTSPAAQSLRTENADRIRKAEVAFSHPDATYSKFELQSWQRWMLDRWVAGDFDVDVPGSGTGAPSAQELTRAVLDGTVAQPFFPGIEAGVMILDPTIYAQPFDFRISHAEVSAGDLTALMALPWQADFLKCNTNWWPTQRPNATFLADGSRKEWLRPALSHRELVEDVMRLAVVAEPAGGSTMVETRRDPTL
jgi:hypothetical protein